MTFVPVMWAVWGLTILLMAGMLLYRSRLARDEEDQIFLDDSFDQHKADQAAISARIGKFQPAVKVSEIVAGVATLFLVAYYIIDMINQFR